MFNPDTAPSAFMPTLEAAARSLKIVLIIAPVRSNVEIETAITALEHEPGGGLVVMPDVFTFAHRTPIILAAARNKVPAVYGISENARDGGLLSYGPDLVDNFRRAASYVDRILRGEKPGDLPVQFPTKFECASSYPIGVIAVPYFYRYGHSPLASISAAAVPAATAGLLGPVCAPVQRLAGLRALS
jgi:ABC-type uncharacterized transport system substrate-binding protein